MVGCEVTCGELMWLVATCRVMWFFFVSCLVTSCDVMSRSILSFHAM